MAGGAKPRAISDSLRPLGIRTIWRLIEISRSLLLYLSPWSSPLLCSTPTFALVLMRDFAPSRPFYNLQPTRFAVVLLSVVGAVWASKCRATSLVSPQPCGGIYGTSCAAHQLYLLTLSTIKDALSERLSTPWRSSNPLGWIWLLEVRGPLILSVSRRHDSFAALTRVRYDSRNSIYATCAPNGSCERPCTGFGCSSQSPDSRHSPLDPATTTRSSGVAFVARVLYHIGHATRASQASQGVSPAFGCGLGIHSQFWIPQPFRPRFRESVTTLPRLDSPTHLKRLSGPCARDLGALGPLQSASGLTSLTQPATSALHLDIATARRRNYLLSHPAVLRSSPLPTYAISASQDLYDALGVGLGFTSEFRATLPSPLDSITTR